jgi:hypothetical protein
MKIALSMLAVSVVAACSSSTGPVVHTNATVHFNPIEGGFYELVSDADGVHYDPTNLAACYKKEGLRVEVTFRVRNDLGGFHMAGPIVDIESIAAPGRVCSM